MDTVFYAWQSDVGEKVNRFFIGDAIKKAIILLKDEHGVELQYDEATRGEIGAVNILEKVFKKIDRCVAFVADVTIVTQYATDPVKYTPNANVLVELGYAAKTFEWENVTLFYNKAFCKPGGIALETRASLPFDIGVHRTIAYDLPETATNKEREALAKEIAKDLARDLKGKITQVKLRPQEIDHSKVPYVSLTMGITGRGQFNVNIVIDREQISDAVFGVVETGTDQPAAPMQPRLEAGRRWRFMWKSRVPKDIKAIPPEKAFIEFRAPDGRRYRVEYAIRRTKEFMYEFDGERRFFVRKSDVWVPVKEPG